MAPRTSSIETLARQSPPLDLSQQAAADDAWVGGRTIVITGGAGGFGAGFFRRWAKAGATVVIGDVDVEGGGKLVREVKRATGNEGLYFFYCDVTDWQSQVEFFKQAVKVSPTGGIDTVVANAGIVDTQMTFEKPVGLDAADPPPPNLKVLDVNLKGVMYTTHLALFYLPRNPNSSAANPTNEPARSRGDRHLILLSSMAGLAPIPGQTLYAISKHAVVGLFRNLRCSSFAHGVRVNLICPYFIDTSMLSTGARFMLAGGTYGKPEDVVEAATRFVADRRIVGRAVVVGPRLKVELDSDGEWQLAESKEEKGDGRAIHEVYAHDLEEAELFTKNFVRVLNQVVVARGWIGWFQDIVAAVRHGFRR